MVIITFPHAILGKKSPLPKGTSPLLHCLTHYGDSVLSQGPLLQGKAAVLGACQLKWWSNKICQQRKHTTTSYSCCGCFLFFLSTYPLGHCLIQKAKKGDIRVNIWPSLPGVMYMKAYGAALLLVSKHRKDFAIPCYLVDFPYGSNCFWK